MESKCSARQKISLEGSLGAYQNLEQWLHLSPGRFILNATERATWYIQRRFKRPALAQILGRWSDVYTDSLYIPNYTVSLLLIAWEFAFITRIIIVFLLNSDSNIKKNKELGTDFGNSFWMCIRYASAGSPILILSILNPRHYIADIPKFASLDLKYYFWIYCNPGRNECIFLTHIKISYIWLAHCSPQHALTFRLSYKLLLSAWPATFSELSHM